MCTELKKRGIIENSEIIPGEINLTDYLDVKMKKKELQRDQMKEELERKELENCTFKPKINKHRKSESFIDSNEGGTRINTLYTKGKDNLINRKDKTKEDIEIEKYGKECTFKPQINDLKLIGKDNLYKPKNYEKYQERMKNGRIEREAKANAFKRGIDVVTPKKELGGNKKEWSNGKVNKKDSDDEQDIYDCKNDNGAKDGKDEAILVIKIKIGDEIKNIQINKGDTAENLADKFALENNLDEISKKKIFSEIDSQFRMIKDKFEG